MQKMDEIVLMSREGFFNKNGSLLSREELQADAEHQIAVPVYDFFKERLDYLKKHSYKHLNLEFCVINNYDFNAHAARVGKNEYLIAFRSGLLPMSIQLIGEQLDFLQKHITLFDEKEGILGVGVFFIFSSLFGHELGHILRGHIGAKSQRNMAHNEDKLINSKDQSKIPDFINDADEFQMLIELDADTFSSSLVAGAIINIITKLGDSKTKWKQVIELAYYSIFLIHNELTRITKGSKRYPPPILRTEVVFSNAIEIISSTIRISKQELKETINSAYFEIFSHLDDVGMFEQDISHDALSELDDKARQLAEKYPKFSKYVVTELSQSLKST